MSHAEAHGQGDGQKHEQGEAHPKMNATTKNQKLWVNYNQVHITKAGRSSLLMESELAYGWVGVKLGGARGEMFGLTMQIG